MESAGHEGTKIPGIMSKCKSAEVILHGIGSKHLEELAANMRQCLVIQALKIWPCIYFGRELRIVVIASIEMLRVHLV